jgi:glycine hydroxymethyltransferase
MEEFLNLFQKHEEWRKNCLNLIASENIMSPLAEKVYLSDLQYRYGEGKPFFRYYQGLKYVDQMEDLVSQEFRKYFQANFADLRPISGTIANLAAFASLAKAGDKILTLGMSAGSHISHEKMGAAGLLNLEIYHLDLNFQELTIDLEKAKEKILKLQPKFIVLGGSVILFPQPVKELKKICQLVGTKIIYDGAHVLGLIGASCFQNPLAEGADLITASTHKTFPGPQGGLILGEIDNEWQKKIEHKIFPGSVSNHHLHRLPALYVTLKEMEKFGKDYNCQTVKNAQALAKSLADLDWEVLGAKKGFTQSHQVVIRVSKEGGGRRVAQLLEKANIIVNKNVLLGDPLTVIEPSGIRLGVQEMTRFGMGEEEMIKIASLMEAAIHIKKDPEEVKKKVIAFRQNFQKVKYGFDQESLADLE